MPKLPWPVLPRMPRLSRPVMPRMKMPEISEEMRAPLTLFAALGLAAVLAIVIAVGVAVLNDSGSNGAIVADVTATPVATAAVSETPAPTEPGETATPAAETPAAVVPPTPQGVVSAALWSNVLGQWWYGDLAKASGQYNEGDFLPVLATFAATPGQAYDVRIVYDCATDDAFGAIDFLSGTDSWGSSLFVATGGPGKDRPDAAVPVPDTPDFPPDDGAFGVIDLFGGHFATLPAAPQPGDNCDRQRALDLPVLADGAQVTLVLSGHLATAQTYGEGEGASSSSGPFGIEVSVAGIGSARVNLTPDAVLDLP